MLWENKLTSSRALDPPEPEHIQGNIPFLIMQPQTSASGQYTVQTFQPGGITQSHLMNIPHQILQTPTGQLKQVQEPLNSEDDVTEDDPTEVFDTDNVVVCQFEKVSRNKNKWNFNLKDGIMNLDGKDHVFKEADW